MTVQTVMTIKLRDLRKQNKKTLADVANALNVARSTVSNYEQGTRRIGIEQVFKLADLYGESAETIVKAQLNTLNARSDNPPKRCSSRK